MIFNCESKIAVSKLRARVEYLIEKQAKVELVHKQGNRTLNQNAYLHLLIDYFAVQSGYNRRESKQYYKHLNRDLYFYEKDGVPNWRSSAELDKPDFAKSIQVFIDNMVDNGLDYPDANNQDHIDEVRNEIESNQNYL